MKEVERKKMIIDLADMLEYMKLIDWAEDIAWYKRVQEVKDRFCNLTWAEMVEVINKARSFVELHRSQVAGGEEEGGAI